jgi:hypothetical protein
MNCRTYFKSETRIKYISYRIVCSSDESSSDGTYVQCGNLAQSKTVSDNCLHEKDLKRKFWLIVYKSVNKIPDIVVVIRMFCIQLTLQGTAGKLYGVNYMGYIPPRDRNYFF